MIVVQEMVGLEMTEVQGEVLMIGDLQEIAGAPEGVASMIVVQEMVDLEMTEVQEEVLMIGDLLETAGVPEEVALMTVDQEVVDLGKIVDQGEGMMIGDLLEEDSVMTEVHQVVEMKVNGDEVMVVHLLPEMLLILSQVWLFVPIFIAFYEFFYSKPQLNSLLNFSSNNPII